MEGQNNQYSEINKKKYEIGNKKLSADEKKLLLGSIDPTDTILIPSRIGDNGALNIEVNNLRNNR